MRVKFFMIGIDRAHHLALETSVGSIETHAETDRLKKISNPSQGYSTLGNRLKLRMNFDDGINFDSSFT